MLRGPVGTVTHCRALFQTVSYCCTVLQLLWQSGTFTVEFPNHALLDQTALDWLTSLRVGPLSRSQMMALATMRNGVTLSNSSYRVLTGVQDSRAATRELKELVDTGLVDQAGTRGSTTYQLAPSLRPADASTAIADRDLSANEERVLAVLSDTALSRAEIETATGLPTVQVHRALRSLRDSGYVRMLGKTHSPAVRWTPTP